MIYKNSHICIISIDMSRKSVMKLPSIVNDVLSGAVSDDVRNHCRFFHNIGNKRKILRILHENLESQEPFQYNNQNRVYFVEESLNDISNKKSLFILFELHSFKCSSTNEDSRDDDQFVDAINLEYVCLLYHYLFRKGINFLFAISGCFKDNRRYTPVENDDFYRARPFLFLESLYGINDKIRILINKKDKQEVVDNDEIVAGEFANNKQDDSKEIWASFYKKQNVDLIRNISKEAKSILNEKEFGKILPLIQINSETYRCLQSPAQKSNSYTSNTLIETRLHELLKYYIGRLEKKLEKEAYSFIIKTHEIDNLFEAIIVASILYFYLESSGITSLSLEQVAAFYEKCIDSAQGFFQLVENSYYHVVYDGGWANLALRIRNDNNQGKTQYRFEFNISDLDGYNDSLGIVSKFIKNHPNEKFDKLRLIDFFGVDGGKTLFNFFSQKNNIANHYGLMILNNVVISNNGAIRVRSGNEIYPLIEEDENEILPWFLGTAYVIDFPIVFVTEEPNYYDCIAFENMVLPNTVPPEIRLNPRTPLDIFYPDYLSKENAVKKIRDILLERISDNLNDTTDNPVLVVDCSKMLADIQYEIMAKSFFLLLCDTANQKQQGLKDLAFINLRSRHHAIKLFRHFALFYDRSGKNTFLNNANIFIVDKDASLPLHFMGDINDIFAEKNYLSIYGGVDSMAIAVLNALGRHFNGPQ